MSGVRNTPEKVRGEKAYFPRLQARVEIAHGRESRGVEGLVIVEGRSEGTVGQAVESFQNEVISMTTIQLESGGKFSRVREH